MGSEEPEKYLSPDQPKKLLAFGVIAALTSLPFAGVSLPFHIHERIGQAILDAGTTVIEFVASLITHAIFGTLGFLFTAGTREFLFFAPPGQLDSLSSVWMDFLPIFWGILPVTGAVFFLGMMLFPEKEEADIYRFMERTLVAVFALIVTSPVFTFEVHVPGGGHNEVQVLDLFSAAVFAVNEIGLHIFPSSYSLDFMQGSVNVLMGGAAAVIGGAGVIVGVAYLGFKFALGVLLVVGTFYVVLAMRMLLIYTVYAMMPLFLALWVVDIGPMKYGKMVTSMVFKLTAVLLLLGIIISGILATTSAIAGGDSDDDLAFNDSYNNDGDMPAGAVDEDEDPEDGVDMSSGDPPTGLTKVILQIFAWFGGIVLSIALTTSLLGMVISMRGGSGMKSRMRQGRTGDAPTGPQVFGGGGGGGGGGGAGAAAAGGAAGGAAGSVVARGNDGGTVVNPANSDESAVVGDDGNVSTFDSPAPEPEAGSEGVPIRDKVDNLTGGRVSNAKDKVENTKDRVEFGAEASDVVGDAAGDHVEEAMTKDGTSIGQRAGEKLGGDKGAVYGGMAGAAAGKAAGKISNAGITAAGKVPKAAMKGANLAKRGGQAYWSVFKQPDVASSLGETARIARESPIGKPDEPDTVPEDGPVDPEDAEDFGASDDLDNYDTGEDGPEDGDGGIGNPDEAENLNSDDLHDARVDELNNDPDKFENGRFNLENVEYQEENSTMIGRGDDRKEMQKGEFVDPDTGETVKQVGFGTDNDTPELEDGEQYNLENVELRSWNEDKPLAHEGVEGDYTQVKVDDNSSVSKVETTDSTETTGETSDSSPSNDRPTDTSDRTETSETDTDSSERDSTSTSSESDTYDSPDATPDSNPDKTSQESPVNENGGTQQQPTGWSQGDEDRSNAEITDLLEDYDLSSPPGHTGYISRRKD